MDAKKFWVKVTKQNKCWEQNFTGAWLIILQREFLFVIFAVLSAHHFHFNLLANHSVRSNNQFTKIKICARNGVFTTVLNYCDPINWSIEEGKTSFSYTLELSETEKRLLKHKDTNFGISYDLLEYLFKLPPFLNWVLLRDAKKCGIITIRKK